METYINRESGVDFSHSVCPSCMAKHYPEVWEQMKNDPDPSAKKG